MNTRPILPSLTNEDRLPHARAVWRDERPAYGEVWGRQVSVDYGNGLIEQALGQGVDWPDVKRWRWGWAPQERAQNKDRDHD